MAPGKKPKGKSKNPTGPCRLCGTVAELVKSHIIPQSFYKAMRAPQAMRLAQVGKRPRLSQSGVYDHILCDPCEKRFDAWDNYAYDILERSKGVVRTPATGGDGKVFGYTLSPVDYQNLKLFFISVLWRASVSTDPFFAGVSLGPHATRAAQMILTSNAGPAAEFAVILDRLVGAAGFRSPFRSRIQGVNFARLYLSDLGVWIKVDRRPVPREFVPLYLRPNTPVPFVVRQFADTGEARFMLQVARRSLA